MTGRWVVLTYLASTMLAGAAESPVCAPVDCVKRIRARVGVRVLQREPGQLAGTWTSGGGLSGRLLYLFEDESYIYTEWADILPQTIFHKGSWRVAGGTVFVLQDADITWYEPGDRRYVVYRPSDKPETLLFGLDFMLGVFEGLVREQPADASTWLELSSFRRRSRWKPGEGDARKAELMNTCWRPEFFAQSK